MSSPEKAMFRKPVKAKAKESLQGKSQIMSQIYKERTNNTSAWSAPLPLPLPPPLPASAALSSDAHARSANLMAMAEINANV